MQGIVHNILQLNVLIIAIVSIWTSYDEHQYIMIITDLISLPYAPEFSPNKLGREECEYHTVTPLDLFNRATFLGDIRVLVWK